MPDLTPIQILSRDHLSGNTRPGNDRTSTLACVVDYLRLICPEENELLLFSDRVTPETNTGRLFAVTQTHAALLSFGRSERGAFAIDGPVLPLSTVVAVRFRPESTVWADGGGSGSSAPSIAVEFSTGDAVNIGYEADYGWTPRSVTGLNAEEAARSALLERLLH